MALLVAGTGGAAIALGGCSPLSAFNTLVPKDGGIVRIIADSPYGPDPRQKLDVYRPMNARRDLPVIVWFYGGSWNSGSKDGYAWLGRALAARGFVVVVPDYRLVPQVRFPAFVEDGAAAIALVTRISESLGADPNRIVVAGHSAGAYNAAMLAYDQRFLGPERDRIKGFAGLAGPYDFLPLDGPATRAAFGQARDQAATQPINQVDRADPPAFIATGGQDRTVHPKNAVNFAARLEKAGIAVERHTYPKVGHVGIVTAIAKPLRGRAAVLDDIARFAHRVTGQPSDARPGLARPSG